MNDELPSLTFKKCKILPEKLQMKIRMIKGNSVIIIRRKIWIPKHEHKWEIKFTSPHRK